MHETSSSMNPPFAAGSRSGGRPTAVMAHDLPTRLLHGALLLSVVWQLLAVNFVRAAKRNTPGQSVF